MTKMQLKRTGAGTWINPLLDVEMEEVDLEEVEMYVLHRQNTAAKYIST